MTFHVLPGSLWTAYEMSGKEKEVLERIPDGLRWAESAVFENGKKRYYLFFNFFRVRTPYFDGHRLEVVITVADKEDKLHFLILEYHTDAISSDPLHYFRPPDRHDMTIHPMEYYKMGREYVMDVWMSPTPTFSRLDEAFVRANDTIYYASSLTPNHLCFDEDEVGRVVRIDIVCKSINTLWASCREYPEPDFCFVYPHPVSFLIRPKA